MKHTQDFHVSVDYLQKFMEDVFIKCEVPEEDAKICAEILISADIRGIESHGIGRLKMYVDRIHSGQIIPQAPISVIRESPTTIVLDGNHGFGMLAGTRAMKSAISKAKIYGMGSAAVRNSTHFGIAGYYALMAAREGMLGMAFTNARPCIAPTFGTQPMLGTNPIAFAVPSEDDFPFIFDAATSIAQRGKVEIADREGHPIPEGLVIDQYGNPMTDPKMILDELLTETAALLPLGGAGESGAGYKGYGLGTMVEILCAAMQSGAYLYGLSGLDANGQDTYHRIGHFFMVLNIEAFTSLEDFKKTTGGILSDLRNSRKAPGEKRIFTAGEKEYENEKRIRVEGIPIIPALQEQIRVLQKDLGLEHYSFGF